MFSIVATLFICYVILFLYSIKIKDNSIADVFWWAGFLVVALISFLQSEKSLSQIVVTTLVTLWSVRIISHIGVRKLRERKEDPRYAKWREEWGNGWYFYVRSFLQVYILQMILMLVVAIPILVVNLSDLSFRAETIVEVEKSMYLSGADFSHTFEMTKIQPFLIIGPLIALFGLIFETIADRQLSAFIKTKKPGEIFMKGLYRYSRHPNYFWESVFWLGISLIALPLSYLALIGWVTITVLLLFVSWVPLQEARYAWRPDWEEYRSRTSVFVPWFPRK